MEVNPAVALPASLPPTALLSHTEQLVRGPAGAMCCRGTEGPADAARRAESNRRSPGAIFPLAPSSLAGSIRESMFY